MVKKILLSLSMCLLFYGGIECILFAWDIIASPLILRNYTIEREIVYKKYLNHIKKTDQVRFCDFIHVKAEGHKLFADCVSDFFKNNNIELSHGDIILAIGGSTTEGSDCQANTKWTSELEKKVHVKVVNLGASGENSDYSINILKENLNKNNKIKYVLEGDWINEILEHNQEKIISKNKFKVFLTRGYYTLYREFRLARLLGNSFNNLHKEEFNYFDFLNITLHQNESIDSVLNSDNKLKTNNFRLGRNDFKNSIEKYKQNMDKIKLMSNQYGFEVLVINFPYVKNYYRDFSEKYNNFFDKQWIPQIKKAQFDSVKKNNFLFVDVEQCFEKKQ